MIKESRYMRERCIIAACLTRPASAAVALGFVQAKHFKHIMVELEDQTKVGFSDLYAIIQKRWPTDSIDVLSIYQELETTYGHNTLIFNELFNIGNTLCPDHMLVNWALLNIQEDITEEFLREIKLAVKKNASILEKASRADLDIVSEKHDALRYVWAQIIRGGDIFQIIDSTVKFIQQAGWEKDMNAIVKLDEGIAARCQQIRNKAQIDRLISHLDALTEIDSTNKLCAKVLVNQLKQLYTTTKLTNNQVEYILNLPTNAG